MIWIITKTELIVPNVISPLLKMVFSLNNIYVT